jgi:transformation/transcription domain-associated protein
LNQVHKQFQPKETLVYIRLVKWAMEALDIYTLNTTTPPPAGAVGGGPGGAAAAAPAAIGGAGNAITAQQRAAPMQQAVRTKEEKEVLEHFAGVFGLLHPQTFKEVFTQTIDYVVERINKNYALQVLLWLWLSLWIYLCLGAYSRKELSLK